MHVKSKGREKKQENAQKRKPNRKEEEKAKKGEEGKNMKNAEDKGRWNGAKEGRAKKAGEEGKLKDAEFPFCLYGVVAHTKHRLHRCDWSVSGATLNAFSLLRADGGRA